MPHTIRLTGDCVNLPKALITPLPFSVRNARKRGNPTSEKAKRNRMNHRCAGVNVPVYPSKMVHVEAKKANVVVLP